ncbi:NACHT domain-containing protein [Streptomyces sp. NPDC005931]|uniref:NACHT domain-containing protein n=1 Tax=Streptomyces sp. NPDC005931 TaxID=3364737 RepID=UPI00367929FB
MDTIADFYRALRPRRLVITGSPGAGKTFMAIELVLGLLENRAAEEPVPVRLTLTDWDTGSDFRVWLAKRVAAEYDFPVRDAHVLVGARRVLPVLDGLDEMDGDSDPHAATPRAIAVVDALNRYLDGRSGAPVVLTCRSWRYQALIASDHRVFQAAHIQISPVTAGQARAYLDQRETTSPDRWSVLLDALGRVDDAAPVEWLSTPWRLTMVAAVHAAGTDPLVLVDRARQGLADEHLLGHYVSAAVDMHPVDQRGRYSPLDAERWLGELARYLHDTGRQSIVLHELWGLGRGWPARAIAAAVGTVLGALAFALVDYVTREESDAYLPSSPLEILLMCLGVGLALGGFAAIDRSGPRTLHFESAGRQSDVVGEFKIEMLALAAAAAALGTFLMAFNVWPFVHDQVVRAFTSQGPPFLPDGLVLWAVLTLWVVVPAAAFLPTLGSAVVKGCAVVTGKRPVLSADHSNSTAPGGPLAPLRRVLLTGAVSMAGLTVIDAVYATPLVLYAWVSWPAAVLGALGYLLLVEPARWCVWFVTFRFLVHTRLPWRTGAFLNWACEAGLLRVAGLAYDFRHRELQDWLMARSSRPPSRD